MPHCWRLSENKLKRSVCVREREREREREQSTHTHTHTHTHTYGRFCPNCTYMYGIIYCLRIHCLLFLQISSLKAELGRPCEIPRLPPPLPLKPTEEPSSTENKSSVGDDDAFEEGEPSPVAPCPYLSFVPFKDDPRARRKKSKEGKP